MFSYNQTSSSTGNFFSTSRIAMACLKFITAVTLKFRLQGQNPLVHTTDLIVRVPLKNGQSIYSDITLNERGGVKEGECKLKDGDSFMPTGVNVFLRKVSKDTAATVVYDGNCIPSTFPDPNVFNDAGAAGGPIAYKSLNTLFGFGANLTMKSEGVEYVDKLGAHNFLSVPDRPYSEAAALGSTNDVPQMFACCLKDPTPVNPTCCIIEGGKDNSLTYSLAPGNWNNLEGGVADPKYCYEMVLVISGKRYAGQTKEGCTIG